MEYELEFKLSEEDYLKFNLFHVNHAAIYRSGFFGRRWLSGSTCALLFLFTLYTFLLTGNPITFAISLFF